MEWIFLIIVAVLFVVLVLGLFDIGFVRAPNEHTAKILNIIENGRMTDESITTGICQLKFRDDKNTLQVSWYRGCGRRDVLLNGKPLIEGDVQLGWVYRTAMGKSNKNSLHAYNE